MAVRFGSAQGNSSEIVGRVRSLLEGTEAVRIMHVYDRDDGWYRATSFFLAPRERQDFSGDRFGGMVSRLVEGLRKLGLVLVREPIKNPENTIATIVAQEGDLHNILVLVCLSQKLAEMEIGKLGLRE